MAVSFSGYHPYHPFPSKTGYVADQSQLLDITGRGPNSTGAPPKWSEHHRPSTDTYVPSDQAYGPIKMPDSFSFTVPDQVGHIDMETGNITWKENTEHAGERVTVSFRPKETPMLDPYDYYTDDPYSIRLERIPASERGETVLHDFLRQDGGTLIDAAQHLAAKGAITSEVCRTDLDAFVKDTLDFFTGGQYTEQDISVLRDQVDQVVRELAEQRKAGKEMDIRQVQTRFTIAGADTSAADLFQFHKVGRILEDSLREHGGTLNIVEYGKTGVTVAAAKKFAAAHGELGAMFHQTVDRLYAQHRKMLYDTQHKLIDSGHYWNPALFHDSSVTGLEILDVYAKADFGDPASLAQAHRTASHKVLQHCHRFNLPSTRYVDQHDKTSIEDYAAWVNAQIFG